MRVSKNYENVSAMSLKYIYSGLKVANDYFMLRIDENIYLLKLVDYEHAKTYFINANLNKDKDLLIMYYDIETQLFRYTDITVTKQANLSRAIKRVFAKDISLQKEIKAIYAIK